VSSYERRQQDSDRHKMGLADLVVLDEEHMGQAALHAVHSPC